MPTSPLRRSSRLRTDTSNLRQLWKLKMPGSCDPGIFVLHGSAPNVELRRLHGFRQALKVHCMDPDEATSRAVNVRYEKKGNGNKKRQHKEERSHRFFLLCS